MKKQEILPANADEKPKFSLIDENFLKSRIYTIRGVKVMLDADLAEIYGYEKKVFNQQVKNNIEKFDADFRFQLNREDFTNLTSEFRTSDLKSKFLTSSWGGLRKMPFAFTEQGIYMLMTVLKGNLATRQSMALIRLFKQMKDYIVAENQQLLGNADIAGIAVQTAQNTHKIATVSSKVRVLSGGVHNVQDRLGQMDLNLQMVMENFIDPITYKHFLIFDGQKLEADVTFTKIYGMAKKSIIIIDIFSKAESSGCACIDIAEAQKKAWRSHATTWE